MKTYIFSANKLAFLALFLCSYAFPVGAQLTNALYFDGVDDHIDCGNNTSVNIIGNQITIEAWIYPTSWKSKVWEGNVINKEQNTPNHGYMLRVGDNGKLNFNLGNDQHIWNELTSEPSLLSLNTWAHVAGTYNGSYQRIYINGVVVDSASLNISIARAIETLNIGAHPRWNRNFKGIIDEVRIWNISRTTAEINQTMISELCGNETGLVAYYQFNQGVPGGNNMGITTLTDKTANGNDGILRGFTFGRGVSNWVYGRLRALIDTSVNQNGITLTAIETGLSYQWIDCRNNSVMAGETNQSFTPTVNGDYAVVITSGNCSDTSSCHSITSVGLEESRKNLDISVYPNPVRDYFIIETHMNSHLPMKLSITTSNGSKVFEDIEMKRNSLRRNSKNLASGIYILNIQSTTSNHNYKLVKY